MSGLRRWSLLVLLLGREGRGEMLEQAREAGRYLLCMVAHQSEFHTSQKLRRALQLYSTYSRLWGEEVWRDDVVLWWVSWWRYFEMNCRNGICCSENQHTGQCAVIAVLL